MRRLLSAACGRHLWRCFMWFQCRHAFYSFDVSCFDYWNCTPYHSNCAGECAL